MMMTNEEISKWLMNLKDDIGKTQYQSLWHYAEALDMAIEALSNSQKQSDSLIRTSADAVSEAAVIYRADAIDIVNRYDKSHMILKGKPMLGAASIVIELEELPSAQPEIIQCKDCRRAR